MENNSVFLQVFEVQPGTFYLDPFGLAIGQVIKAGTVVEFNEATRSAKVVCCRDHRTSSVGLGVIYEDTRVRSDARVIVVTRALVDETQMPSESLELKPILYKIIFVMSGHPSIF